MNTFVKREIFPTISQHLSAKEVTVVIGARQTGKTTLLNQLKEFLTNDKKIPIDEIKFFNLDLISDLEGIKDQSEFIKFLKEELRSRQFLYVFIDEIQRLANPGQYLKGIYDLKLPIKLIVTGSSSLEIRTKISESLTGRKRIFYLPSFSFSEYLKAQEPELINLLTKKDISLFNQKKLTDYFYQYLIFGGYPRVVLATSENEKIQLLNEIYSSYIEKDIIAFLSIKNSSSFSQLVAILADQIGNLVNVQELANTLGLNRRTVENYAYALENTFVIDFIKPYFTNTRKELSKMTKIYFADLGLRNLAVKYFSKFEDNRDKGQLLENFVQSVLKHQDLAKVNYWRTKDKSEVDFIYQDYFGNILPIETKAIKLTKPEISRGFRFFINKYKPKKAFIVNLALEKTVKIEKTEINFILPYQLDNYLQ